MFSLILIVIVSMSISFACSIMEACLLSLSNSDLAKISEKNHLASKIWLSFKKNISRPIAVILLINTFAHTVGASLSGARFSDLFGGHYLTIFSVAYSVAMIQWTEILPKTIGTRKNKSIAVATALPMKFLTTLLTPFVMLVNFFNRPFEGKKTDTVFDSVSEISILASFASRNKMISPGQADIIENSLQLSQMTLSEVMIPYSDIKFMTTSMSLSDALVEAHLHNHTRFPLADAVRGGNILGYVNFKDIAFALRVNPSNPTLSGIVRPIMKISANETVSSAMKKMIDTYQHIATVHASDGQPVGLVTLEDLIESLIGDVNNEYDVLPDFIYPISISRFVVGGGVSLAVLREKYAVNIMGDTNINEWILSRKDNLHSDEKVFFDGGEIAIRKIRRSKVFEAIIEKR